MKRVSSYIFSADVIRVLAIVLVITIHTFNEVHARTDFLGGASWMVTNVIVSLARISIPLFIMLSGYLILRKNESFGASLTRAMGRVMMPLLIWTVFYLVWNVGRPSLLGLQTFIPRLYFGGIIHLYFLIIMVGLYMVAPFISAYVHAHSPVSLKKMVIFFLGVGLILTVGQYVFKQCMDNSFTMWIPYAGYFLTGYVIGVQKPSNSYIKYSLLLLSIAFLVTAYFNYLHLFYIREGMQGFSAEGCISHYFDNYVSINVMIMSISAFALLFHADYSLIRYKKIRTIIGSIAKASFGIYIVHIFVLDVIERVLNLRIDTVHMGLLPFILTKWLVVFAVSYTIALWGMRVPYIRRAFGVR